MPDHSATAFHPGGDKFTNVVDLAQVNVQKRQEAGAIFIGRTESLHGLELGRVIETDQGMTSQIAFAEIVGCAADVVSTQSLSSSFHRT